MRYLALGLLLVLTIASSACRGSIDERDASEIKVFNAADDSFISDGDDFGNISLAPGGTMQLKVTRTTDEAGSNLITEDVTNEVSWELKTAGVATISPTGLVTANAAGTTEVQVEFDDGDSDFTDTDVSRFFINVAAAP